MSDPDTSRETALIQSMKTGDNQSYQEAVRIYTPGMLAVARFYLDHSSAEEIVQDCWVTVIDAIQKFEGRSGLKTWLHRIVANRCKNRLRSSKREVATDFSESLEPELASRFNAAGRWDLPPKLQFHESADTLMENGALSDCLDKHLSSLPETQRSALILYEAHQHKSDDVCNILDVSASNLRVLLHRARQKIFLMVETFQETGEC
ncbi:RNA polymerase sigma factor [Marinobacter sp. SS8-8]|uniref:RNA polymerase sigma factor n=1 Tax=Marinobacter sp. SS8-8 TaxID=3050452 RepID=UPI0026E076C7|nr:RNA polymerase sigma factor [Marinobacter sp. SS8-8]|tara:strand:- start:5939 stop:6556 length:618 start_codon:yes stop_codon:yes gene_type:complete